MTVGAWIYAVRANTGRWFRRMRPSRRAVLGLLVIAVLALLHPLILRMLAWPLQSSDAPLSCDYFCLHGGEMAVDGAEPFDRAAQWHGQSASRKVLLLLPRTTRIVEVGAVPSFEQTCRRELAARDIPAADVESLRAEARNAWDEAHALDDWLTRHPKATVALGCSPFAGGRLRFACDKVLAPANVDRLRVLPLADPACPAPVWWRTCAGVKDFMYGWLELLYARCQGDDARAVQPGAADFQREVRTAIGEAPQ